MKETAMLACVDVDYRENSAVAACALFRSWTDGISTEERVELIPHVEPYQPGQFYKRELPCLLAVLGRVSEPLDVVIVDGYVWLRDESTPGLGARLYDALGGKVPVIGVAKTAFRTAEALAQPVLHGSSCKPLFVTAAGLDAKLAAAHIQSMHGTFRIPTLLKRVDRLCRQTDS
jgi:deoxyribonuclease V